MTDLRLRIDHVVIELADHARVAQVEPAFRRAMEQLAEKLLDAGVTAWAHELERVVARLDDALISAEDLLLPGGAERLADSLFETLMRRSLTGARLAGGLP
ncbi:hypothetical protein ACLESO_31800 [Pyxidicoccus sp. 3LG]